MIYQGKVIGGAVVLEGDAPPEGSRVRVEVVEEPPCANEKSSLLSTLSKYAGAVKDLPADMARNHDHYIHGASKR